MRCPFCGFIEQKVLDSRPTTEGDAIRRRRECTACNRRFTTFERAEKPRLLVVKRRGERTEFFREKVLQSMIVACHKRPVTLNDLRDAAERVERRLYDEFEGEIPSSTIGDLVMRELLEIDHVAYVRFASVYREFTSPEEFAEVVGKLSQLDSTRYQLTFTELAGSTKES